LDDSANTVLANCDRLDHRLRRGRPPARTWRASWSTRCLLIPSSSASARLLGLLANAFKLLDRRGTPA